MNQLDQTPVPVDPASSPAEPPVAAAAPAANYRQKYPFTSEGLAAFDALEETAVMPPAEMEDIKAVLENLPTTPLGNDKKSTDWMNILNAGITNLVYSNGFSETVARPTGVFEQVVESATSPLGGFAPKQKNPEGVRLTGESASFQIRQALGMGTVFSVPLWHSGFWITLKAPSEGALLELYRKLTSEKAVLGRSSYGFIFSNGTSYTSRLLLDFVTEHIHQTSLLISDKEDIRSYIRLPDLPLLIWGIACAVWPNGFQYNRSCISDPEKCKHVIKEKLNLTKLLWTDTTSLTERQVKHMTNRQKYSMAPDAVKRYVDELIRGQDRTIKITDALSMTMRIPTATEHIDAGYRWVHGIEETYSDTLTLDERNRDDYIIQQGKATTMRQYAHFVKAVVVGEHEYDDVDVIEETLNNLTSNDKVRNQFMDATKLFLDESIVSLIAIPTFTCPNCGGEQHAKKEIASHPHLIPLDVTQTFFQLLVQKLRNIRDR